jgi:hypothetical protein
MGIHMEDYMRDFWLEYYVDVSTGICLLCMNSGILDTAACAAKDAWKRHTKQFPCICPNGQSQRKQAEASK